MFFYIGLDNEDACSVAYLHYLAYYVARWRLAQVVDIGLECKAHHCYNGFTVVLQLELEDGAAHFLGTPHRFVIVYLAGGGDDTCFGGVVGGDEVGVYSYAVAAYAATGLQDVNTRVLVGKGYQLPYVNVCLVADERELVGEGYLHVAAAVLGEFAHLGGAAVGAM